MKAGELSNNAKQVLQFISQGYSYEQILARNPTLSYLDIFSSDQEVLDLIGTAYLPEKKPAPPLEDIRRTYPRAYAPWNEEEDAELQGQVERGDDITAIAFHLGRQPSAIRSRIRKLGLPS